jgi:hypothetical protein
MYWLIEDLEQLKVFYNSGYKEAFIDVISSNSKNHPIVNDVSLVYLRPIDASKGYILSVNHSESTSLNIDDIRAVLNKFDVLYTLDKKELLHYFPIKALYDINTPPTTYIRPTTQTHELYYRKYSDNKDLNKIIPIVKHYEICEQIYGDLKDNINKDKTKYDEFFNDRVSVVFNAIERSGIQIHKPTFEEYFHKIDSQQVYTQYNLKTTTTRPSNKFNGVNYAALNKENGCRKSFLPKNDKFIEMDISAYHPTLASKLINYEFPTSDIHQHFAELYKVDYKKAKELTFKQLYGGVFKEYKELEFFSKIEEYVSGMWHLFDVQGYIECPVSSFVYTKEGLDNMNPQKLFNYLLQNAETSTNILVLWDIFRILRGNKTQIVLYTYDSILLDVVDEEVEVLEEIRGVFEKYKLNIKEIEGYDYSFR